MKKLYLLAASFGMVALGLSAQVAPTDGLTAVKFNAPGQSTALRAPSDWGFPDDAVAFSYMNGEPTGTVGTGQAATLRAAIEVNGGTFAGQKIVGMTVSGMKSTGLSKLSGWIANSLGNSYNVTKTATINGTELGVMFDQPYEVPADGTYVGYTLTCTSSNAYPIPYGKPTGVEGSCYMAIGASGAFSDYSGQFGAMSITVYFEHFSSEIAVGANGIRGNLNVNKNQAFTLTFGLSNGCTEAITDIDYTYTLNGETVEGGANVDIEAGFNKQGSFSLDFAPISESGVYPLELTINKVNGQANTSDAKTFNADINVMAFVPVNRPLMEEFTGTWCGWCPRGWVALEKMNELYPEFIGAAWHNDDPMQIAAAYPVSVTGFPSGAVNRKIVGTDPYYGESDEPFGIYDLYASMAETLAPADIDLAAEWQGDSLKVSSKLHFAIGGAKYKIGYLLCEDGYNHKDDPKWYQQNYFNGKTQYNSDPYLAPLVTAGSVIKDITYNEVVISNKAATGVANSVPANVEAGEFVEHEYLYDCSNIRGTKKYTIDGKSQGYPLLEDRDKVFVIAMLIDGSNKQVVNSRKVKVGESTITGVNNVMVDGSDEQAEVVATRYYDLQGRLVVLPENGLYIRQQRLSNGQVRAEKVVLH